MHRHIKGSENSCSVKKKKSYVIFCNSAFPKFSYLYKTLFLEALMILPLRNICSNAVVH